MQRNVWNIKTKWKSAILHQYIKIKNAAKKTYREMKTMNPEINIRVATLEDAEKVLEIYGYYIENTAITYEYEIPTLEEFKSRMIRIKEILPYLVAEKDGEIYWRACW